MLRVTQLVLTFLPTTFHVSSLITKSSHMPPCFPVSTKFINLAANLPAGSLADICTD